MRRLATIVLLAVMAALLVSSSLHKRLVYDETDNLSYGFRFLTRGPGVPPLGQRMPVLVFNALGCLTDGCDDVTLDGSEGGRLAVRAGSMVFALGARGPPLDVGRAALRSSRRAWPPCGWPCSIRTCSRTASRSRATSRWPSS